MEKTKTLVKEDLDFVVQTAAPAAGNKTALKEMILEDQASRKAILADDKLFNKVIIDKFIFLKISPALFFEILLRHGLKEMERKTHTVERSMVQRLPIFDLEATMELMEQESVFFYLVDVLDSFISYKRGGISDIDIDRLIKLGAEAPPERSYLIHKRIADLCLFVLGIFPEYLTYDYYYLFFNKERPMTGNLQRGIIEYEELGQTFYKLALTESGDEVFETLSKKLTLIKKPLNFISENYLVFSTKIKNR